MYMVVHDIKHPTEALINGFEANLQDVLDLRNELKLLLNDYKKEVLLHTNGLAQAQQVEEIKEEAKEEMN